MTPGPSVGVSSAPRREYKIFAGKRWGDEERGGDRGRDGGEDREGRCRNRGGR